MMKNARPKLPPGNLPHEPMLVNGHGVNGSAHPASPNPQRKQRVTITLPSALLERLRNAVYWTGHSTLAHLIADSLDEAVTEMEQQHGGPFPARLSPLKRGRPRLLTSHLPPEAEL